MNIKSFLKLVEIQTKTASVISFLLGSIYVVYRFKQFNPINFFIMFASLLCIDMATTAINNYMDFKKANKKSGFGYETHNAIVRYNLKESSVVTVISLLLLTGAGLGVVLVLRTNIVILLIGAISFAVGILYSFGPIPISRTPFGEVFSGLFMGLIIPFLAVYIHVYDSDLLRVGLTSGLLTVTVNLIEMIYILLLSLTSVTGIANIMLANNICDMDDDLTNLRYTLPIFIGKKNALYVFSGLYYCGYAAVAVLVILQVLPILSALTILTLLAVQKNIRKFYKLQTKKDTFVVAVKNFSLVNSVLFLTIGIAVVINMIMG